MKVAELREILAEVEAIFVASGAKRTAEDFKELQQIFEGSDDEQVDEFLEHLRKLYAPTKKPRLRLVEASNDLLVEKYIKRLQQCSNDSSAVDKIISDLKSDGAVKKAEANAIQYRLIKGREAWPSKKAAIEAIQKSFAHRRREADQLKRIKTTTPW